jgi:hypothetical protein
VAHELGDQDQVMAGPDQGGAEGVPEDVAGEVLVKVGIARQLGQDIPSTTGGEPAAAVVEEGGRVAVGRWPRLPLSDPDRQALSQLGVDRELAVVVALAGADDQDPLAGG